MSAVGQGDEQFREQRAAFDVAWPCVLQEELSQPVALLLTEDTATIRAAAVAGFWCFADGDSFKRCVAANALGETAHA